MGITVNLKTMTIWDYNNKKFTWNTTNIPGFNACKLFKFQTRQYDILTLWPVADSHSHKLIVTDTTFSLWFNTNTLATDHKLQKSSNFHVKITYLWTKVLRNLGGKNPLLFLFNAPFGCCVNARKIETNPEKKKITFHFMTKVSNFHFSFLFSLSQRPNSAKWWIERKKKDWKLKITKWAFWGDEDLREMTRDSQESSKLLKLLGFRLQHDWRPRKRRKIWKPSEMSEGWVFFFFLKGRAGLNLGILFLG